MTRAKSLVYQKILTTILLLLDKIMEPNNLLGEELTLSDQFIAVEKLVNMLGVFTQFQDQLRIEGADTELKKISDDLKVGSSSDSGDLRSKEQVKEFMNAMLKSSGINPTDKK
jgi:Fic family protein